MSRHANAHRARLRTVVDAVRPKALWHGHFHRRYSAEADLGYGPVAVHGLDCDGSTMDTNVAVVALDEIPVRDTAAELDVSAS